MTRGLHRRKDYDTRTVSPGVPPTGAVRRCVAALLGLFLLTVNLAAAAATPPGDPLSHPSGSQHELIEICTGNGMLLVSQDGTPLPDGSHSPSRTSGPTCVFCLPFMHAGFNLPAVTFATLEPPPAPPPVPPQVDLRPLQPVRLSLATAPRAPPFA